MLELLTLKNFKSARELTIPMAPLTVLSGYNGSGKSTLLQAIALMRQSLILSPNTRTRLHLRGPLVELGSSNDVHSDSATTSSIELILKFDEKITHWKSETQQGSDALETSIDNTLDPELITINYLKECHFQYLQADRLTPQTQYNKSNSIDRELGFLGTHGQHTPDFLSEHGDKIDVSEPRRHPRPTDETARAISSRIVATNKLNDQVSGWLQQLSPGVKLKAEKLSDTDLVALRFGYATLELAKDSNWRRPTNVGYGLTYSLPILTACLAAPPGSLLLLENPEAHLHPRGQAALGKLLAKCAADNIQIIVETHSDHILNGVRLAVKENAIPPASVRICNFTRDLQSGDSFIETPTVLPNGELNSWPDGFFDEWDKSLESLLS